MTVSKNVKKVGMQMITNSLSANFSKLTKLQFKIQLPVIQVETNINLQNKTRTK